MSGTFNTEKHSGQPMVYQIRLKGHLDDNGETLLTGPVVDQAALHGLLKKVRDVGLPLVSVIGVKPDQAEASETPPRPI